ncbi:MAG: hypothetical protein AABW80_02365 [Nanoarchaeota archaeon]
MPENYLDFLILKSKAFAKKHNVFDIVIFGSGVKGKIEPEDTDIALIFNNESLEKRMQLSHEFKNILKIKVKKVHIESINISDLFDASFFARQGIIIEGQSLIHKISLSKRLGFESFSLFSYTLKNLNHSKKTSFTYSLIGRNKMAGIIKNTNAKPLGKGAIIVPIENSIIFEEFMIKWCINYTKKNILISRI